MRALLPMVLCLSMAVYVIADDLVLGQRQEGDYLVFNRKVKKSAIANNVLTTVVGIRGSKNEIITYVKVTNVDGSNAMLQVVEGGIGSRHMLVLAIGQQGEELNLKVEAYGKKTTALRDSPYEY